VVPSSSSTTATEKILHRLSARTFHIQFEAPPKLGDPFFDI
jgi:hypothetical protein